MPELVCPIHGPYDASYGTCPYCGGAAAPGQRPAAPRPLAEDDMPTDLGYAGAAPAAAGERAEMEAPTELGGGRKGSPGFLDMDDEKTELGRAHLAEETELEFAPSVATAMLWVKEGPRRGQIYKLKENAVVGRAAGELILDDPKVSNPHAKFTLENDQFVLWDFGSKNGTYVNGQKIRAATELKENDIIKIGDTVFVLKTLQ